MRPGLDRLRAKVRQASTEDLLDRATVYRDGMEPEALAIIDRELEERRVGREEVRAHGERRRQRMLTRPDGSPVPCHRCHRPAVTERRGWYRLFGLLPVFPRPQPCCEEHAG